MVMAPDQSQMVPLQAVPEIWRVGPFAGPQEHGVAVQISTPGGMFVHFLSDEAARKVASDIRKAASGLIEPPSGLVIPQHLPAKADA